MKDENVTAEEAIRLLLETVKTMAELQTKMAHGLVDIKARLKKLEDSKPTQGAYH